MNIRHEEVEELEISERDLDDAFDPTKHRNKFTKEPFIYGEWESACKRSNNAMPFSRGSSHISFISGSVSSQRKSSATLETAAMIDNDRDLKTADNVDEFLSTVQPDEQQSSDEEKAGQADNSSVLTKRRWRELSDNNERGQVNDLHGVGQWEKYTKGIGMKLLLKMGFESGKGLGRELQGRSVPVEAVRRKGKGAMGAYGPEREKLGKDTHQKSRRMKAARKPKTKKWKRNETGDSFPEYEQRQVSDYWLQRHGVTEDEANEADDEEIEACRATIDRQPPQKMKIVDMTCRNIREFESFKERSLSMRKSRPDLTADHIAAGIDDAQDFLQKELSSTEFRAIAIAKQTVFNEQLQSNLDIDIKTMDRKISECQEEVDAFTEVLQLIDLILEEMKTCLNAEMFFGRSRGVLETIVRQYPNEFKLLELHQVIIPAVASAIKELIDNKDIFGDRAIITGLLDDLRVDFNLSFDRQSTLAFEKLVWDTVAPSIRQFFLDWDPREPDSAVDLVEDFKTVTPSWMLNNFYTQLVVPKLTVEVENWDPITDSVPVHVWIHPWLACISSSKLEVIFDVIRKKLSNALSKWHPSDNSARLILKPWQSVFLPGVWHSFMAENIVPKLSITMMEMTISHSQQNLDAWNWMWNWKDLVPAVYLIQILENYFFPKFMRTLAVWLACGNTDYTKVADWFTGWKALIPSDLANNARIKHLFKQALQMMNSSMTAVASPYAFQQPFRTPDPAALGHKFGYVSAPSLTSNHVDPYATMRSVKDIVERRVSDVNLVFSPIPSRTETGKQIYKLGRIKIYFEGSVIFVISQTGDGPKPTPLETVLRLAG